MGESTGNIASLKCRIEQLEHEREELQRDIEQLCMQQSGSGYIGIITRIQAQRIAGLEQEIETSKQKLAASMRNNHNLQEELSEVYRIKSQLADLHKSELEKENLAVKLPGTSLHSQTVPSSNLSVLITVPELAGTSAEACNRCSQPEEMSPRLPESCMKLKALNHSS